MIPNGLLILGFGGHARSVGDVAIDLGISALIFVDAAQHPRTVDRSPDTAERLKSSGRER